MNKKFLLTQILCVLSIVIFAQNIEDFSLSKIPTSYSSGSFLGNNDISWSYVNARGNQQTAQNKNSAISLNKSADACLYSDTLYLGIKTLEFQYEQELSVNCSANVFINDSCVGLLQTTSEPDVTKIFRIDSVFFPNAVVKIQQTSASSGQITIDDIYIEFAQKPVIPFVLQTVEISDSLLLYTYSNEITSAVVESYPSNIIRNIVIDSNTVTAHLYPDLCGEFRFTTSNVLNTTNVLANDTSFNILFSITPQRSKIVISEIMADPSPVVGLLDFEYIEIANTSDCSINCKDLILVVGQSSLNLPEKIIKPNDFICLISEKAKSQISDTAQFCFIKSFPSITNSGQTIALLFNTEIISSVSFNESWLSDNFKYDGGWAFEKIDNENLSESVNNWNYAKNKKGGTPGYINSIAETNSDNTLPNIKSIQKVSDSTIAIKFSENIYIDDFIKNSSFSDLNISKINSCNYSLSDYEINLSTPISSDTEYTLYLTDSCTDIAGNYFTNNTFVVAAPDSILEKYSILISEIMFNPLPAYEDFIELYNNSDSYFDLSQLFLSNGTTYFAASEEFTIFPPRFYAVISPDAEWYKLQSNCEGLFISADLPTMPDESGTIILFNKWKDIIDSVSYNETMHSSLSSFDGVSLERISYITPSVWHSAAESIGFSSLGCKNSQQTENKSTTNSLQLNSEIITPNGDGENDNLLLFCSESNANVFCSVRIFSTSGKLLKQITNNELVGSNNIFQWDCTDDNGDIVPAGIYLVHIELIKDGKKQSSEKLSCTILRE